MQKAACCPDLTDPPLSREPNSLLPHPSLLHLRNQECSIPAATGGSSCLQDTLKTNCCNKAVVTPLFSRPLQPWCLHASKPRCFLPVVDYCCTNDVSCWGLKRKLPAQFKLKADSKNRNKVKKKRGKGKIISVSLHQHWNLQRRN